MAIRDDNEDPIPTTTTSSTVVTPAVPKTYVAPKAPDWWKSAINTSAVASASNALLPYMAPNDTRLTADWLARNNPTQFGTYANLNLPSAPTRFAGQERNAFLSKERAQNALTSLENMRVLTGKTPEQMGAGYSFLKNIIGVLNQFGGDAENGMSRAQYNQMQTLVNQMLTEAKGTNGLEQYGSLAETFFYPTGTDTFATRKTASGKTVSGEANKKLFR